jgi:hypothetical protein
MDIGLKRIESTEQTMICVSFVLLLLSCVDQGFVGNIAKLFWLTSLVPLMIMNIGAALGMYVGAAAIYSAPYVRSLAAHGSGWGSILERPDNFALAGFVIFLAVFGVDRRLFLRPTRLAVIIVLFLLLSFGHAAALGLMTRANFAVFMRMFGLPFIVFLLLMNRPISRSDVHGFLAVISVFTVYLAVISVLERFGWHSVIVPTWIADPQFNQAIETGRSGGTFLQSEWNGFALGLGYCIVWGAILIDHQRPRSFKYGAALLCLAAIFFTYTRAAWLGAAMASLVLLLRPSSSGESQSLKRLSTVAVIVIAMTVVILFPGKTARQRAGEAGTAYFRINLWVAGLKMAMDKPVVGHGFGQFKGGVVAHHEDQSSVPYAAIPEEGMVAHNTPLNILVEEGVLGLLLYGLIFIYIYVRARRSSLAIWWKEGPPWVMALTLVYVINTQFIVAYEPTTNFIYYGTMGLLIAAENTDSPQVA